MENERAAMVAWVRAVEEADPGGEILPEEERVGATRAAAGEEGREGFLVARAGRLIGLLKEGEWALPVVGGVPGWAKLALVLGALAGGVALDRFDGGREINVLAFPLMGLLAWNVVLYVAMLVGMVRGAKADGGVVEKLTARWAGVGGEGVRERYFRHWWPMVAGREICGVRAVLHLAAAAAALGIVGGMYWRGIATEYRATWESTFLSAEVAERFLGVVLWPASALSGLEVPALAEAVANKGDTARWIHLFAITAGVVIVVPRVVLAGVFWLRSRGEAGPGVAGEGWGGYEEGLRNALRGGTTVVAVVPFASGLDKWGKESVRKYVVGRWGGGAVVEFCDVVAYGGEEGFLQGAGEVVGGVTLVVCQLTATPEDEVQGELMRGLRARREGEVILLVDERGFRERFGAMAEYGRRLEERRAAWHSVIRGDGFETVMVGGEG